MTQSAELVVRVGQIHTRLEEASAKGFKDAAAMKVLIELESAVDALLAVATAEHMARPKGIDDTPTRPRCLDDVPMSEWDESARRVREVRA